MINLQDFTPSRGPLVLLGFGVLGAAYAISAAIQPIVRRAAIRSGFLDLPDGDRRTHAEPVPRLGGIGVFVAVLVAASIGASLDTAHYLAGIAPLMVAMAIGATILFAIGLVDDLIGVRPAVKLVVQSVAALIVCKYGFHIDRLILPTGSVVSLGMLALPVAVLWIVGLSNAFNLVDGADGLAGGVAIIALAATAISAWILGDNTVLFWSLALTGAMLGFLRFNLPPARIFLGDSGSLVVGFLLSILVVKGMSRQDGALYAIAPIFALCYPLLDTGTSMMRRWLRGEPLSRADGRHIHHQLQALGLGARQMLAVIYGLSALVATLGLFATFASPAMTIAVAVAGGAVLVLLLVYGARWLQYHEFLEAGASLRSMARTGRSRLQDKIYARELTRVLATATTTQELAAIVEDNAETFRFAHMQLRWGTGRDTPPMHIMTDVRTAQLWSCDYPIIARRGSEEPLFLSAWCNVDAPHFGALRILEILAPAVQRWIQKHPQQFKPGSFHETPALRLERGDRLADRPQVQPLPPSRRRRVPQS